MTSAGEVEQFVYCPHNWLLARQGIDGAGEASRRGIAGHHEMALAHASIEGHRREARRAFAWSLRVLGLAASATFLTLELLYLRSLPHHVILLATALVMVSASAGLLVIGLIDERRSGHLQRAHGVVPGRLLESNLAGGNRPLEDPEWGLTGRPDSLLEISNAQVPVEVKTGQTPDRPFANHRLQLACYLRLLEATQGRPPAYGLLTYPEGVFRVAWDRALQEELRQTLERIREAERTGRADRDHAQPGRCRGCARREACDQRLA